MKWEYKTAIIPSRESPYKEGIMYRPEDWNNPYTYMTGEIIAGWDVQSNAFEAGADAILEKLKKEAIIQFGSGKVTGIHVSGGIDGPGYLVFIPGEINETTLSIL